MATNVNKESESNSDVTLGFLEEAESWLLLSNQFPSKVGGTPAWLSQVDLPTLPALLCEKCKLPTVFLLQVYAPISGYDRCFHRTLFVFCCKTPACYTRNDSRCFKVFRCQLPRINKFYPFDPPSDEMPEHVLEDHQVLGSGLKLCRLCGCLGQKACSRCHSVTYCCKEHQTIDWKNRHKKECANEVSPSSKELNSFLFPEWELVTEPEELPAKDEEAHKSQNLDQEHTALNNDLENSELESMALHETQDSKVFLRFKERIANEPEQVLRYCKGDMPLWVSAEHVLNEEDIPKCSCGAKRIFEFQIMPQLLNHLKVDRTDACIDWGTVVIYTCVESCDQGTKYSAEFIWKQDFSDLAA
ncbi:programmed cell death protein 2 [Triplophysa rosa]|uniref:Programmed cell death protein 2 n=1 Tax=Triplophysa rosa TaxID=992332 RepID=A0A9W7WNB9_TRIRA|nr:programmed cell death protein 2 [Triplophysa rosa]KAI7805386.1 programmed cell death protein 2 [Triplophysa rosa]